MPKKSPQLKVSYQFVNSSPPEDIERRLDRAFAVVFEEVMRIRGSTADKLKVSSREVIRS